MQPAHCFNDGASRHPRPLARSLARPLARVLLCMIACALLAIACVAPASAQPPDGGIPTTSGGTTVGTTRGSLVDAKTGEFTMEVNVWGFVRSPGKYTVPISARLIDVISLAGGPTERAELDEVKVVHDQKVDSTLTELVRVIDLDAYKRTGDPTANPVLYPNDTIVIPGDNLNTFNQVVSVVSNVAVVTLSVIGLIFAFKKNG